MSAAEVVVVTSSILGVSAIAGLIVKWILLPYLREQVVKPVQETYRQVTPHNRPEDAEPTIVDRLDDVQTGVGELRSLVDDLSHRARTNRSLAEAAGRAADSAHKRLTDHEAWAREEDRRLWAAVAKPRLRAEAEKRSRNDD